MSKIQQIERKLKKPTTIKQLSTLTGWQPHSVRAALTKLRQSGVAIERTPDKKGSRYQITADA